MTNLRRARKPVFLWQAGLILLPVVIMAAVAITAIIQNRADVEREARRQAEEVARQYGKALEGSWGFLLMQQDVYSQRWSDYLANVAGGWPGAKRRMQMEAEAARVPALSPGAMLAEWQAQYPGLRAEEVFPDGFWLSAEGRFRDGLEFNPAPQPPVWLTALSPEQRAAWEALKAAAWSGASVKEVEERIAQFQETGPDPEAGMNAVFIGMRARLAALPPKEAVAEALRSAQENRETFSETGLPLANLAFGEALRYARATGPSEALWEEMRRQVLGAPSPLIPALLDELEEIAGTNTTLRAGVDAWRTLWDARLKLHDIAEIVRQTGKLRGITTTNFWLEHDQTRGLCVLNPEHSYTKKTADGALDETTKVEAWTAVRFLPKSVAERALVLALENAELKLPSYLGLAASLEGEPLALPEHWSPRRDTNSAPLLLAEANGALSNLGKLLKMQGDPLVVWDGGASRPRFVLRICLADPALLFASYRRHALLLAGLVAASAFGALIGVLASWHAFRRQLRLNELKSNFVSSVSHELRSPIASVRLMAESLERGKVSEAPKQQEYFRFIVQECRRLSSLIENVLDFSRIEQGRKQYDFEPTDLVALTRQTVKLMETYAAERGVKLQLVLPGPGPSERRLPVEPEQGTDLRPLTRPEGTLSPSEGERDGVRGPSVEPRFLVPSIQPSTPDYQLPADGKALQQALVNLIDNALKHSPKGGTVTVGLELGMQNSECRMQNPASRNTQHGTAILLWVEDHGEGIPLAEQEKIFERFYRRGSELRRQTQGVGIGLSIVKHIVEAHGGKVLVRSAPGRGSRFTIELPVPDVTAKSEARSPKPE